MAEIKNEEKTSVMAEDLIRRRKLSKTPPPRAKAVGEIKDWVPWPDLDEKKEPVMAEEEEDPFESLAKESDRQVCRQLSDMGFPSSRVIWACKELDADSQKIINFCLLVDKFLDQQNLSADREEEAMEALKRHSMNEDKARNHLKVFGRLKDLGFSAKSIHEALVACDLDHDKSLEHLLK